MSFQRPAHALPVYRSAMLPAVSGANMGDALCFAAELQLEDSYRLTPDAALCPLSVTAGEDGHFTIAASSETGTKGAKLALDSCLTFMTRKSEVIECLVLVEIDDQGHAAEIYALPLAPMEPKTDYLLVGIDRDSARTRMAQLACVSFTRGTHVTMASGEQRPIETLAPGDRVLTRDDGAQPIRWIGQSTHRAVGVFAPVVISAGTLHNSRDLVVSPDHRLFIYQRSDALGAGRSELLIKARHLVNGETITVQRGGFVDYFQLLFDRHQIIFAEGIAAETLLADPRNQAALPRDIARRLLARDAGHRRPAHLDFEIGPALLDRPDAADLLRRASTR